jgi:hypothetical protein
MGNRRFASCVAFYDSLLGKLAFHQIGDCPGQLVA